jgi:hypothetical protein
VVGKLGHSDLKSCIKEEKVMIRRSTLTALVACLALGSIIALSLTAGAVRPIDARVELIPEGTEWILGHSGDLTRQRIAPLPAEFAEQNGDGTWYQRLSGPHGGFRRIWGQGLAVDPSVTDDAQAGLAAAEQFWRDNEYLLPGGVTAEQLVPLTNSSLYGVRIVAHHQTADGVPVLGTGNYLAFLAGRLVLIGARNLPVRGFAGTPAVAAETALEVGTAMLAERGVVAEPGDVELVALPVVGDDTVELRLVYAVDLRARFGRWTAYVDALSGEGFALRDERIFLDATLKLRVHTRHAENPLFDVPASHLHLTAGSEDVTTDIDGAFSATGDPLDVSASLTGLYADVHHASGSDIQLATSIADGETHVWTDEAEFEQAQLDAYRSVNVIRDYIRELVDDLEWLGEQQLVNANVLDMDGDTSPDYCNAWTDFESLNFLTAGGSWGGGCYNTAMNADIVMHEWGHVFHGYSVFGLGVGTFDEAVSEGFADTAAVTITHDSTIAPHFTVDGYAIRNLEPDKVWPYDQDPDPHQTGLIVGGALWDLRKILVADHGFASGHALLDEIYVQVVRTTSTVPSLWEATLLADDDNGDLTDGTPNFCSIYTAYDFHGLISGAFGRVLIDHEPIYEVMEAAPIAIAAEVYVIEEECNTLGDVRLVYSTDQGENWTELAMDNPSGDTYQAQIPTQPLGTEILYRIEADEEDSGDVITQPNNAAEPFYKIYVGPLIEIFCDDFEDDDGGWTHELVFGENIEGADDWMWGTPNGNGGDPEGCYSGEFCWGNDLAPEDNWNGMYQNSRCNRATSPPFDLSEYDHVRLRFRRWLNVEDGFNDQARIYVNDAEVWKNFVSEGTSVENHETHHEDLEWILFDLDVSEWAAGQSEVEFALEIRTNSMMMFGGWTFDDFCLYTRDPLPEGGPDGDPGADGGALPGTTMAASGSGCDCDTAGARASSSPGLFVLLSTMAF